jgi:uncharacterized membrane protein
MDETNITWYYENWLIINTVVNSFGLGSVIAGIYVAVLLWVDLIPLFQKTNTFLDYVMEYFQRSILLVHRIFLAVLSIDYLFAVVTMSISPYLYNPSRMYRIVALVILIIIELPVAGKDLNSF